MVRRRTGGEEERNDGKKGKRERREGLVEGGEKRKEGRNEIG